MGLLAVVLGLIVMALLLWVLWAACAISGRDED
jgi:hypothetical protein